MDVLTAVFTAQGESTMTTQITEQEQSAVAAAASQEQKPEIKAKAAPQKPRVGPEKGKSGKKTTTPAKKGTQTPKGAKAAKSEKAPGPAREGSKTAKVLDLLKRADGATLKEIMKATGWQPHSVRGFISGTLGKKLGLTVESAKREDGERVYSLKK